MGNFFFLAWGSHFTSELWNAIVITLGSTIQHLFTHRLTAWENVFITSWNPQQEEFGWEAAVGIAWAQNSPKRGLPDFIAELGYHQLLWVPGDLIPDTFTPWSAANQRTKFHDKEWLFVPVPAPHQCLPQFYKPGSLTVNKLSLSAMKPTIACCTIPKIAFSRCRVRGQTLCGGHGW